MNIPLNPDQLWPVHAEIKDSSIRLAMESVKKIISTSIDKSKLDNIFEKNLEESKIALNKIKSKV